MDKEIFILTGLLFISVVVGVWLSYECSRLSKELGMTQAKLIKEKQATDIRMFSSAKRNIKEISSKIEIPFEYEDSVTENEIKEALLNNMYPQLKPCLDYAINKDIAMLTVVYRGRLRVVEVCNDD